MQFEEVAAAYLAPLAAPIAEPLVPGTPARRLRDALEPIATQGWWSKQANGYLSAFGLDFFQSYVWGRAASLGEPSASVVVAAFGVFEPAFLSSIYDSARGIADRDKVLEARARGATEALGGLPADEAGDIADALFAAVGSLDGTARPLFSGLRQLAVPDAPQGRLWRAAELVREHRGDGHLAACIAAGLGAVTMTVFTEVWLGYAPGEYLASRGYGDEALSAGVAELASLGYVTDGAITEAGRQARATIEQATDASQAALVAGLGDRLEYVVTTAGAWSAELVANGSFPPDPRKRAAG